MARPRGMQRVFLAAAAACVMAGGGAAGWGDWKDRAASIPSKCFLRPETGLCRGFFPSYFYNPAIGNCDCFVYGGCAGNDNNFKTMEECARECRVQHPVNTPKCKELFDEQDFRPQPSPPDQPQAHPPYHPPHTPQHPPHPPQATQHPPLATQHPPLATQHPPLATQHPPLATQHPPLATQHPPLATQHPPQATQHPPQATQHPPQATQHPPLAIHPWQATAVLSGPTPQTVQPVYSFPRHY
ncbi:pollen-specific leucine-rich repeat extensin-like protein 1 [Portunus trituberculatus]|uniref:pollen-specific leucine-rich repeat extensin-like protein 1 n=1 Tax=Portunus trituberculatus TaxID=210409 RepID=UPI001E1D1B6E|nr:pollen-specific leucine-rich repeat extensin-like protein 1 [Portunus trituberculatus]XP_045108762.1 pollen-specific leucine-rich repeat extensin-like protein 1 [Portunus trituberculatus]XP_045108763.1 pollen-specific leucine-rich repeat extensin-like protein 1 [Portunus trituberculatus]